MLGAEGAEGAVTNKLFYSREKSRIKEYMVTCSKCRKCPKMEGGKDGKKN